jgi:uncharacterized protein YndB with AHSA1/START domain
MDVRPGGIWRFNMLGPDGKNWPNRVRYEEVVRPERLVYLHDGDDDTDPFSAFHVTVTFQEHDGQTTVTMRSVFPTVQKRDQAAAFGAVELGHQTLAKLEEYVAAM